MLPKIKYNIDIFKFNNIKYQIKKFEEDYQ